ncbi:MAG: tripartite tricarboxylate transporter substrate binding protein [Betaproteobacteria bacterium]|nr:MAG: tripartite tricarboxylate transporter substrate binding protein [Betaproteobacteria bacterium]
MTAVLHGMFVALLVLVVPTAYAATYPHKPVRFIVPYPPGGNADLMARLVAQKLTEYTGQNFVTDNRGGAGGVIGEEIGARSPADGYTIVLVSTGHTLNPAMRKKLAYDPLKDLAAVSLLNSVPSVLVVHNSVKATTLPEFIALAKSQPGKLNSVFSMGTTLHVALELFKSMAGVNIVNVTYKSGGLGALDLDAGRVHMSFAVMTTAANLIKGGRVRALAVTSAKRSPAMPDVPAMAEFLPGYDVIGWQGIVVPAGTPRPIIDSLSRHIAKAMRAPDVAERLASMGSEAIGSSPDEFDRYRVDEYQKLAKLMAQTSIKPAY